MPRQKLTTKKNPRNMFTDLGPFFFSLEKENGHFTRKPMFDIAADSAVNRNACVKRYTHARMNGVARARMLRISHHLYIHVYTRS